MNSINVFAMGRLHSIHHVDPATLPHVWRVEDLAPAKDTLRTGHEALDAALPGGGWPMGSVIEVLQQSPAQHVWNLAGPALASIMRDQPGPVVLVGAPLHPFAPGLRARGLVPERLLCVQAEQPRLRLWAAEQALRCAEVAAVLAWLPAARNEELRRLQLAAQQHGRLLFVFRSIEHRLESSPAALRLQVQGTDRLEVEIVKRRGPPLLARIELPGAPPRLLSLLNARRGRRVHAGSTADASVVERSHVLDRTAAIQ
jgi:protein ImuA